MPADGEADRVSIITITQSEEILRILYEVLSQEFCVGVIARPKLQSFQIDLLLR